MRATDGAPRRFVIGQVVTTAAALAIAAVLLAEERPSLGLLVGLAALGCCGLPGLAITADFHVNNVSIAIIAAAALSGPGAAVAVAVTVMLYDTMRSRPSVWAALTNIWAYASWSLAIGLVLGFLIDPERASPDALALAALGGLVIGDLFNFALVALECRARTGRAVLPAAREVFVPVLPWLVVSAALAAGLVLAYEAMGAAAVWGCVGLMLAQRLVLRAFVRERDHGSQLDAARRRVEQGANAVAALAADRTRLVHLMLEAEEGERERLGALLHDTVLQELAIARQALNEGPGEHARAKAAVDEATSALRTLQLHLHPFAHQELGLGAVLQGVADSFPRRSRVDVDVAIGDEDDARVDQRLLLVVARELLVNALKHSGADRVSVRVVTAGDQLELRVVDDGIGLRAGATPQERGHLGLALCSRRVEDAGGRLTLGSGAGGRGTRVDVTLPLARLSHRTSAPASRRVASSSGTSGAGFGA
jgi:signal transduction histidine kinase